MAKQIFWVHEDNSVRMEKYAVRYNRKADCTVLRPTGDEKMKDVKCGDDVVRTLRFVAWEAGDTVVWKTSKCLYVEDVTEITGTVKEHGEYRGEKQTELTRCKVNKVK